MESNALDLVNEVPVDHDHLMELTECQLAAVGGGCAEVGFG